LVNGLSAWAVEERGVLYYQLISGFYGGNSCLELAALVIGLLRGQWGREGVPPTYFLAILAELLA